MRLRYIQQAHIKFMGTTTATLTKLPLVDQSSNTPHGTDAPTDALNPLQHDRPTRAWGRGQHCCPCSALARSRLAASWPLPSATTSHSVKMLPTLAATAIISYTQPEELVLDPMCGIGTTLVEAIHLDRTAIGIECEQRWANLARANLDLAREHGAAGPGAVTTGDAASCAAPAAAPTRAAVGWRSASKTFSSSGACAAHHLQVGHPVRRSASCASTSPRAAPVTWPRTRVSTESISTSVSPTPSTAPSS